MLSHKTFVQALLATSATAFPLPFGISKRVVIAHDAVVPFPQTVPSGITGTLMLKYKPWLEVFNGCVPFPAVDSEGNTGGGLNPTGGSSSGCSSSTGQVYARATTYNGAYAIMYSWYMPKDSPLGSLGHRHDWENIVVWLSSASTSATLRGVAISAHGDYQKTSSPNLDGTRLKIGYISYFPVNHQLISTGDEGGEQPLIAWDSMTTAARAAIENTNFGAATPSFRDSNFQNSLAEAFI